MAAGSFKTERKTQMPDEKLPNPELLRQLGPVGKFKPCAQFIPGLNSVVVVTKDCSYTTKHITPQFEILVDNGSALGEIIGFVVYCPESLGLYAGKCR